jgi:hypothetical protein
MSRNFFEQLVRLLNNDSDVGEAEDFQRAVLDLGGGMELELADEGDDVLGLYGIVAELEGEPDAAILRDIAIANYGCAGTDGATLGYDPETRSILLVRYWPVGALDLEAAAGIVDLFAKTLLVWRDRLQKLADGSLCASEDSETDHSYHGFA